MGLVLRMALFGLVIMVALRAWRAWQQTQRGPRPPTGFSEDTDPLVRCEQCGIKVPTSQVPAMRANCKRCGQP